MALSNRGGRGGGGGVCRYYGTSEGCRYGTNCRFAHRDGIHSSGRLPQSADSRPSNTSSTNRRARPEQTAQDWLRLVPKTRSQLGLGTESEAFWHRAVKLVRQDANAMQLVIDRLSSDGGLSLIDEIIQRTQNRRHNSFSLLTTEVLSIFQVLTDEGVMASFVVERGVGTICNYLFGSDGHRAETLFRWVSATVQADISSKSLPDMAMTFATCCLAFSLVIDRNDSVARSDDFKQIYSSFNKIQEDLEQIGQHPYLHSSTAALQKVRLRLSDAGEFQTGASKLPSQPVARFSLSYDPPGEFSQHGPRHDNDFPDVEQIRIMPTSSEMKSHRPEYLPPSDLTQLHLPGVQGILDRQFRLLRQDTVGQLRDAVSNFLDGNSHTSRSSGTRTYLYRDAVLRDVSLDKRRGLELLLRFNQPTGVHELGDKSRKAWWGSSRRLQPGSLVCALDPSSTPHFFLVSSNGLESTEKSIKRAATKLSVYQNPDWGYVTLSPVSIDSKSLQILFEAMPRWRSEYGGLIMEFPGVLVQSFEPSLRALQRMSRSSTDVPFPRILMGQTLDEIEPPAYSQKPGFKFNLSCLCADGGDFNFDPSKPFDPKELVEKSQLDYAQADSLIAALSQRLALIQGPPGTGKSYTGIAIIKALLANRETAGIGPILCVCYTNHALDQLLEHVARDGVNQIIRIGSRSKSAVLSNLNLHLVSQQVEQTRLEARIWAETSKEIEETLAVMEDELDAFKQVMTAQSLRKHLKRFHPHHYQQLFQMDESAEEEDDEGWRHQKHQKRDTLQQWLQVRGEYSLRDHGRANSNRVTEELTHVDLVDMSRPERKRLHSHWMDQIRTMRMESIQGLMAVYRQCRERFDHVSGERQLRALKQAHVIGVTTSGLARLTGLLERVDCKVLICEEAGEILEAHTLTSLLPTIEHAILIGDHQQLRPQTQDYSLKVENPLGQKYAFDVSLFERLVKPERDASPVPFKTLEVQRRMHPSISNLVRQTLYPNLKDAPQVIDLPPVTGMQRRLFWFDHDQKEDGGLKDDPDSSSYSNSYEVEVTASLLRHLLNQGTYRPGDIAILTPYLGQFRKLRERLISEISILVGDRDAEDLEKYEQAHEIEGRTQQHLQKAGVLDTVRLATVDNFQGEEAKVVLVSLVRCNDRNKCGFLRTSNRINVLLSRAQHGMYIIGNSRTYGHVHMWSQVLDLLKQGGNIGHNFQLVCPRHPDEPICVQSPDDFVTRSPEGGCSRQCKKRLGCGHTCLRKCHSDVLHDTVYCLEPCQRTMKDCEVHPCPKNCGDPCPSSCTVNIPSFPLPCGHIRDLPCAVTKTPESAYCDERVSHQVERCGHTIKTACSALKKPAEIRCTAQCGAPLPCGHDCKKLCCECLPADKALEANHGTCLQVCGRTRELCKHPCKDACHEGKDCPPCKERCDAYCGHSRCERKCSEPCVPCAAGQCTSQCPHSQCDMPCAVPCNWIPCSRRCEKLLACGHRCPSLCGEVCPDVYYCQDCCTPAVRQMQVDFLVGETYGEIDLDEEPCVFPRCGHIITRTSLDGHMSIGDHYELDDQGQIYGIKPHSGSFSASDMKVCPTCRGSLRDLSRYGRIVRRALLDESSKRFITSAHGEYMLCADAWARIEDDLTTKQSEGEPKATFAQPLILSGSRAEQIYALRGIEEFASRNKKALKERQRIQQLLSRVREEEQPYYRVKTLLEDVRRRRGVEVRDMPDDLWTTHSGPVLKTRVLLLRCDLALLTKAIGSKERCATASRADFVVELSAFREACCSLSAEARDGKFAREEAQGLILAARFAALEISVAGSSQGKEYVKTSEGATASDAAQKERMPSSEQLRSEAQPLLEQARTVCEAHPGTAGGLQSEVEAAEKCVRDKWYEPMSATEMRQALAAMQSEFRGGGHWYYCSNGHPFTIGECGLPMELAVCWECGASVGGQQHRAVEGVRHAQELELEQGLQGLDI